MKTAGLGLLLIMLMYERAKELRAERPQNMPPKRKSAGGAPASTSKRKKLSHEGKDASATKDTATSSEGHIKTKNEPSTDAAHQQPEPVERRRSSRNSARLQDSAHKTPETTGNSSNLSKQQSKRADSQDKPKKGSSKTQTATTASEKPSTKKQKATGATGKKANVKQNEAPPQQSSNLPTIAAEVVKAADVLERAPGERCFWLMKAEPESRLERGVDVKFSIDDLAARTEPEPWDGVRNPVAQKIMRSMRAGELAFFYHSNCKIPGVAGVMQIVREQTPDPSAFDPKHPYYDPKSDPSKPKWCVVHVRFVMKFERLVSLEMLKENAKGNGEGGKGQKKPLENLQTLKMGRLSVSRVMEDEWRFILGLAGVEEREIQEAVKKLDPID